jgi:hypothetical protein
MPNPTMNSEGHVTDEPALVPLSTHGYPVRKTRLNGMRDAAVTQAAASTASFMTDVIGLDG